jgi:hypothetical protein
MPNVEVKDSTTKGSYTLPIKKSKAEKKKEPKVKVPKVKEPKVKEPKVKEPKVQGEKKPGLFSSIFRHSDHKSKAPALDLPAVERDLSPNNELREPHRHESDPLRIPNIDLPKPDISLPTYDRPEVNMTSGQTKQSSEFSIPAVDLPPISNLHFPDNEKPSTNFNVDPIKVPNVNLPELRLTPDEVETTKLPELHFKSDQTITKKIEEKLPELPLIPEIKQEKVAEEVPPTGLTLSSPINDTFDIQTDQKDFSIETDYEIKPDTVSSKSID